MNIFPFKKPVLTIVLMAVAGVTSAQLKTNVLLSPVQLVNILAGTSGTVITSNATHFYENTVDYRPVGSFTVTGVNTLGIKSGIVLTTGSAKDSDPDGVNGPNDNPAAFIIGDSTSNDPDLLDIAGPDNALFDPAILEFDFIPCSDSIKFRYVFGSEEYPDFVCSMVNDDFGFFLSGPGLPKTNLALLPGTTIPISINTVNGGKVGGVGYAGGCGGTGDPGLLNTAYFVDNGSGNPLDPLNGRTVQYNGYTKVLTASHVVIPGKTYHIKLGISDVGDTWYDSGVFLESGSFMSTPYPIDVTVNKDTLCTNESVTILGVSQSGLNYNWDFDGGAIISGSGQGPYSIAWQTSGEKKIKARANGGGPCSAYSFSDSARVYVTDAGCRVKVPNIFSPNNDGENDVFLIGGLDAFPGSKTMIYSSWGTKIFETTAAGNYWNGKLANGNEAPDGVYYYVIHLQKGKSQKGYLQLIR